MGVPEYRFVSPLVVERAVFESVVFLAFVVGFTACRVKREVGFVIQFDE